MMLLGQDVGGRHHGALISRLCRQKGRAKGHGGLAAAHIPLHQPAHGIACLQVIKHILKGFSLPLGRRKGQSSPEDVYILFGI